MNFKKQFPNFLKIATLDDTKDARSELVVSLTKYLSEVLHFSYQFVYSVDGQLGQYLGGSNWNGMIGMLNRSECDMSVDPLVITESRNEAVLFTYPYLLVDMTFITNKPEAKSKSFAIIQPFSTNVWIALMVSFFCSSFIFCAISGKKYIDMFFMLFGNLFSQTSSYKPKKLSSKLLMLLWMTGIFFLIVSYQATLLSSLSFPSYVGVRNVKELSQAVNQSDYRCLTRKGSFIINYLLNSPDESKRVIGQSLKEHGSLSMSAEDFLRDYKGAYISTRLLLRQYQENYFLTEDYFAFTIISVALRKNFCCKDMLDTVLRRMTEVGIYEKILEEITYKAILKERSKVSNVEYQKKILVEDLQGAFLFLIIGYVLGLLVFFIERVVHKRKFFIWKKQLAVPVTQRRFLPKIMRKRK